MAVYGVGGSGMSGAERTSVSTRFWGRGSGNIRDTLAEGWSFVGNNVGLASNNLIGFGPARSLVQQLLFTEVIEVCAASKV